MVTSRYISECTESIWVVNFSLSRDSSSHVISGMDVSFASHPLSFTAAFQHAIHVYSVFIWCSLRTPRRGNQILSFNWRFHGNTPLNGKRWGCVVYFALSGCSDPDDSPIAQSGNGGRGRLWNPPPPASTNIVQPTGAENVCMLCSNTMGKQSPVASYTFIFR